MQNPHNTTNRLNNIGGGESPQTIKGKPAVLGGQPRTSGEKAATPGYNVGNTTHVRSGNLKNPSGVNLGTSHGKHNVAHPMQSPSGHATNSIQQGK